MEENKNKKNKIIKGIAFLGLFLLVFGVSYAIFSVALNGTKRNRIKTGNLSLTLTDINGNKEEAGYAINLEEIVPMTDEEGLQTTPYQFVVENTGTIPASYTLDLVNDGTNTLQDQYIKYNLKEENYLKKEDNTHYRGGLYNTEPKILENNRKLDEITILPGEKIVYTLNLWLDHDADNDAMGKEFNAKIEINGTQAMAYTKGKAGDNVEYTLYKDGTLIVTGEGEMKGMSFLYDESGNPMAYKIENNMTITSDIVLKKLREKDATLFPDDINGKYTEEDMASEKFQRMIELLDTTAYIMSDNRYDYNYFESCYDKSTTGCETVDGLKNLAGQDLEKYKKILSYLDEIPKIKNITIDEKITILSQASFDFIGKHMLTLPSTFSIDSRLGYSFDNYEGYALIIPPNVTNIPERFVTGSNVFFGETSYSVKEIIIPSTVKRIEGGAFQTGNFKVTIPSSVEYVGSSAFNSDNIKVDNTEEYVKNNWDINWNNGKSPKYLK